MDKTLETLVAELEAGAPEVRKRAEQVAEERLVAYKELVDLGDEVVSFIREKLHFRLASEAIPQLLRDLEAHLGEKGLRKLLRSPNPLDFAPKLMLKGDAAGALLVEDYVDDYESLFVEPFSYLQPEEQDPFGVIYIGLEGEGLDDEYFTWGITAELAHHLVYILRPEDEVDGGIDEFYDSALCTSVLPAEIRADRLGETVTGLKSIHLIVHYLEKAGTAWKGAKMAADDQIAKLEDCYSRLESPSVSKRLGHILTKTPFFRWYLQLNLYTALKWFSESMIPEHLTALSLTWQVLEEIAESTGYPLEKSFDLLPYVAAQALRDPGVNHLVPADFIRDIRVKLPEYLVFDTLYPDMDGRLDDRYLGLQDG